MFAKLLIATIAITVLAAALLGLRQQRIEAMHDMARLQMQMDEARQQTWDMQVRIASQARPDVLREKLEHAGLQLEPVLHPGMTDRPIAGRVAALPRD